MSTVSTAPAETAVKLGLSTKPGECGCGTDAPAQKLDVKTPGTVDSYLRGGPFYLCPTCRQTIWRGRFRKSQWFF